VFREANRQIQERKLRRVAVQRAAAGLAPFDPNVPPQSWNQLVEYLKATNYGRSLAHPLFFGRRRISAVTPLLWSLLEPPVTLFGDARELLAGWDCAVVDWCRLRTAFAGGLASSLEEAWDARGSEPPILWAMHRTAMRGTGRSRGGGRRRRPVLRRVYKPVEGMGRAEQRTAGAFTAFDRGHGPHPML
jgi:hypothetical protein